jgi:arabinose-5-phosphate isomerase
MKKNLKPEMQPADAAIRSALRTLQAERDGLAALASAILGAMSASFSAAVERIAASKGRLIVTGMGKSGHVGRKIAATFASTGTPSYYVHPAEASHGDLGMIQQDDLILALSWSGETAELADIITYARRFGLGVIAFTAQAKSTLAVQADIALVLPKAEEACPNGLAPTTSTTMQLVLGDALAVALLEYRGFTALDFKVFHPGGKLGARLRHVRDCMHRGEELPLVAETSPMSEAVVTMSAKGFGCVIAIDAAGALTGIITDGDLRRHMKPDLLAWDVSAVMTRNPITIAPEMLAVEALDLMERSKRSALIIVENGRPTGLIRLLDLLHIGTV